MEILVQNQKERQYYIDWLRVPLILSVFLFPIGMIFNSLGWCVLKIMLQQTLKVLYSTLWYFYMNGVCLTTISF